MQFIRPSVIVTTYERPKALHVVLESLSRQSITPHEVIIDDDGSKQSTTLVVEYWRGKIPCPILHSWQEDEGFRAAAARNMAVAAASGNYLIFLDGDCIVFHDFIKNHIKLAESKTLVMGSRILCSKELTEEIEHQLTDPFNWRVIDWLIARLSKKINRLFPLIRIPRFSFFRGYRNNRWKGVRTFNLALWRKDFEKVNGFDERFQGWGHEDANLAIRLIKNGIKRKDGQFALPVLHLWHKENDRSKLSDNEQLILQTLQSTEVKATLGLNQYK
jgi:glycosyltransferase involved in cell wall biosynthesis